MNSLLQKSMLRARGLRLARGASVSRGARIRVMNGRIVAGRGLHIHEGAHLAVVGSIETPAMCEFGERVSIGARSLINVSRSLRIGDDTQISWNVQILDTDFHKIDYEDAVARSRDAPVVIGRHVLIGTGSMILKGVQLGDGVVVAAGSVVTRSFEPGWLIAGNPARPVRRVRDWE